MLQLIRLQETKSRSIKPPGVALHPFSFYELCTPPVRGWSSFLVLPTAYSSPRKQNDPSKGSVTSFLPVFKVPPWLPISLREQVKVLTVQDLPLPLRPRAPFLPVSLDPGFRIRCLPALLSQESLCLLYPLPRPQLPRVRSCLPLTSCRSAQMPPYGFPCLPAPRPVTLSPPHVLHTQSHSPLNLSSLGGRWGGPGFVFCSLL